MKSRTTPRFMIQLSMTTGVAALYYGAARLGLLLSFKGTNVSPVWPPTGIALASVLLFGYGVWPGVALGAFLANYATGLSAPTAAGITLGNTLEAVCGAFLLRRFVGVRNPLDRAKDVFKFIILAGMFSTLVSATIGTTSLYLGEYTHGARFSYLWWTWWLGDSVGVLAITPLILAWRWKSHQRWNRAEVLEFVLLLLMICGVGNVVFGTFLLPGVPLTFLTIPLIVLAAFRFEQRGASAGIFLLSSVAVWGTVQGYGPFLRENLNESLLFLAVFIGIVAAMALVLASVVTEHRKAEAEAHRSSENYEGLVNSVEGIVWQSDLQSFRFSFVSEKAERLLGYPVEEWLSEPNFWTYHLHPGDRDQVVSSRHTAIKEKRDYQCEYRMISAERKEVWLRDLVTVTLQNGEPVALRGVMFDITNQKRAEELQLALYRISETTSSAEDMQDFYRAIHGIVGELMYAKNFYIALYEEETDAISFPYFVDEVDPCIDAEQAKSGLTGYVLRSGQPLLARAETFDGLLRRQEVELVGSPSVDWLGVPLKTEKKTFGVLAVQSYTESIRFGEKEKEILIFVSQHIATAVYRKRSEEKLIAREKQLIKAQHVAQLGSWEWDIRANRVFWSDELYNIYGLAPDQFDATFEAYLQFIHPDDRNQSRQTIENAYREGKPFVIEERIVRPDGVIRYLQSQGEVVLDQTGSVVRMIGVCQDITERKQLQDQLVQSQKMETVGRLAGGVAHDFNNILMAITGYCELIALKHESDNRLLHEVKEIQKAAERGASLTGQLLAFSRKQILELKALDLNQLITSMHTMIQRLIGEDIDLITHLQEDLWQIKADPMQLEQVIMNLAVNARDAMPQGGSLIIHTKNVDLDEIYVEHHLEAEPGPYVKFTISDTGSGMDEITRAHIFEPFFTTKEVGKGTGLGLATVFGIVKQSGGYIVAYSELGHGTTFTIYLPRVNTPTEVKVTQGDQLSFPAGSETVLIVDDNEAVRSAIGASLEFYGYKVLQSGSSLDALKLSKAYEGPIHLLMTDVVMPQMGGSELAVRLKSERPELKILYISGFTEEAALIHGITESQTAFVQKPVAMRVLLQKIRELLD